MSYGKIHNSVLTYMQSLYVRTCRACTYVHVEPVRTYMQSLHVRTCRVWKIDLQISGLRNGNWKLSSVLWNPEFFPVYHMKLIIFFMLTKWKLKFFQFLGHYCIKLLPESKFVKYIFFYICSSYAL